MLVMGASECTNCQNAPYYLNNFFNKTNSPSFNIVPNTTNNNSELSGIIWAYTKHNDNMCLISESMDYEDNTSICFNAWIKIPSNLIYNNWLG